MSSHVAPSAESAHAFAPRAPGPILVATDGRGGDELVAARLIADRSGAGVVVVAALQPLVLYPVASEFGPLPYDVEEERRHALAAEVRERIEQALGPEVRWPVEVEHGFTADAIVRAARAHGARLIIMGAGHDVHAIPVLGGETALRVVRRAPCPVLAVAGEWPALPRTALAAVDFSASSLWAAECALPLLGDAATLYVAHVWERSSETTPQVLERDVALGRRLSELLADAASGLRTGGTVRVVPMSLEGRPVHQLIDFASRQRVELMVVGRSGRNAFERLFLGSVATGVLRGSARSVLVVPEPPVAEAERLSRLVRGEYTSGFREAWVVELEAFAKRNAGRRTVLEVDDPAVGAQVQETGYVLLGATYDVTDRRAVLMLGAPIGGTTHLTRSIGGVESVSELSDANGRDVALRIAHGAGQTLLTFLPDSRNGGQR